MKKAVLFLIVLTLMLNVGCETKSHNIPDTSYATANYLSLEQIFYKATDIVEAKFVGAENNGMYVVNEFEVCKRYVGQETDDNILFYVERNLSSSTANNGVAYSYSTNDLVFEKGERYYLALRRYESVFYEQQIYLEIAGNLYIPASDVSKSFIYGEPVTNHTDSLNTLNTEQDIVNYINYQLEHNPNPQRALYDGIKPTRSKDLKTIVNDSDSILRLRINESESKLDDRESFTCTVTSVLKGNCTYEKISVTFLKGTVKQGKEYIVALNEVEGAYFTPSSRNSVFSTFKEKKIMKIIAEE